MIELMVAVAIGALLVFLAAPSFTTFLRNSEIRSTSESIVNGLRAAAAEAANRNKRVTFELTNGTTNADWRFWVLEDDDTTQKTLQSYAKNEAGKNSTIVVTPAGRSKVAFNGLGRVEIDPLNPDDHIRMIDVASAVPAEARPLRIIVDDPNPPAANRPRGFACATPTRTSRPTTRGAADMKPRQPSSIRYPRATDSSRHQSGSYLLEALIAILIFSFGILGLIGLLGSSLRITNDARYRSEAANLASAMIADMWTMTAAEMDRQFGPSGAKLADWQAKAASLLPSALANPPTVDLTQPGLSPQSRTVVVTVFWKLPGESELHKQLMTAQIGKNPT
jgi:type IV pilus assembly protein PilV